MHDLEWSVCHTPYTNITARFKDDVKMLRSHISPDDMRDLNVMADILDRTRGETSEDISRRLTMQARKREEERLFEGTDAVTDYLKHMHSDPLVFGWTDAAYPQQLERVMPSRVNRANYDVNLIFDRVENVLAAAVGDLGHIIGDMVEDDPVDYIQVEGVRHTLTRLIEVAQQFAGKEPVFSTRRPNTLTVGDDGVVIDRFGTQLGVLDPSEEGD